MQQQSNQRYVATYILDVINSVTDDLFRLYAKYYHKMESYGQKVNDIEKSHELYQQVAVLQDSISGTNAKSKWTSMHFI